MKMSCQEKLQAKSKEVLPKAVEPMVVKPKADKQMPGCFLLVWIKKDSEGVSRTG